MLLIGGLLADPLVAAEIAGRGRLTISGHTTYR